MKYQITYKLNNTMNVFTDVVEAQNVEEAEVVLKKLVSQFTTKSVRIILIKSI